MPLGLSLTLEKGGPLHIDAEQVRSVLDVGIGYSVKDPIFTGKRA